MITKLYIENYKGFDKTYIPIEDINFLVGDNSTGKSTVMDLLYLIDHNHMPFVFKFNQDLKMGNFFDMVNRYSDDKSYFSFACEKKIGNKCCFFKWKFKNDNGAASIVEYQTTTNNKTIIICKNKKDTIEFFTRTTEEDFLLWIEHSTSNYFVDVDEKSENDLLFELMVGDKKILPNVLRQKDMLRFSPVRAQAKPYYDSYERDFVPDGDHIAFYLKLCFEKRNGKANSIIETLNKFGLESSLFEGVEVESFSSSSASSPFSLDMKYGKVKVNISNVGYGVSQVMPLIVEMLRRRKTQIAIPQPEVHLHPKAQCAFGTLVFNNWKDNANLYLLETHSEYMINRFRYEMFHAEKRPKGKAQVLFFERTDTGNVITVLPIGKDGRFACDVPDSYGDFFIDEELKMLDI